MHLDTIRTTQKNALGNRFFFLIICIALFAACLIVAFYRLNFQGGLSPVNEHWGTFGDYVGGVLNPFLSFLTLLALLYTINLQIADHLLMKNQTRKEDIFRMIDALFARIESLISKSNTYDIEFYNKNGQKTKSSYYTLLGDFKNIGIYETLTEAESTFGQKNKQIFRPLTERINFLYNFVQEFERLGGDKHLAEFYKSMLNSIPKDLANKGYLDKNVGQFFSIEQLAA